MARPQPILKLISQTDVKDIKHADDCGPCTSAMSVFRGTAGRVSIGWRDIRAAMARNGVIEKKGAKNYTTVPQNIRAMRDVAPEMKKALVENPAWSSVRANLEAGGGVGFAYYYAAAPKHLWSPLVRSGDFQHFAYAEAGDVEALWYDPMYRVGAKPKPISWAELEALARWGLGTSSQNNKKLIGFLILPPKTSPKAPQSHAEPRNEAAGIITAPVKLNASTGRKSASPSILGSIDLTALKKVNWGQVGADALGVAQDAARAAGKENGVMSKLGSFLSYIVANTKLDEMLLDALRTFLTVSISVALGLGIPLLDISGGDFRTVLSAGLASALQVVVKALDPSNSDYGITRKK